MRTAFEISDQHVAAGERRVVDLPVSRLSNHTPVSLPVHVLHGLGEGPTLFVSAAVHGDEIVGVEIIRRLLKVLRPADINGTVLFIPIVNAFGFISRTRYLPDQRDLNRSFPGSEGGSLAAKLAYLFMREVVKRSDFGIDLHTAAASRSNLPQIRSSLSTPEADRLARAFGAPVILRSPNRVGSMREAASHIGKEVLVYEGGEALRFDAPSIQIGVRGVQQVMAALGMVTANAPSPGNGGPTPHEANGAHGAAASHSGQAEARETPTVIAPSSKWVRAPEGGIFRATRTLGDRVRLGDRLGFISNPYDDMDETEIVASIDGLIIGRTNSPVVNLGDALFHLARLSDQSWQSIDHMVDPVLDEDEII